MIVFYTRRAFYTYCIFFFQFCFSKETVAQAPAHSIYSSGAEIQNNSGAQLFVSKNFQAVIGENQDTRLFWQTKNEKSTSYVEIERSLDNSDFQTIAIMFGPEDLQNEENNYEYRDKDVKRNKTNVVYYRLRLITDDGNYQYSSVKTVH